MKNILLTRFSKSGKTLPALIVLVLCLSIVLIPIYGLTASTPVASFVERAYLLILGREGEQEGIDYWVNGLQSNELDAANLIYGFVNSAEFINRGYSNDEQVEILYNVMLNRTSDPEGKAGWVNILNNGCSINAVLSGFTGSQEFKNLCSEYGIIPGSVDLKEGRDQDFNITAFVTRAYSVFLEREPDIPGLNGWCDQINSGDIVAASLIDNFIRSREYQARRRTPSEMVDDLYMAMLGRYADGEGKAHWVEVYNKGVSESYMVEQFTGSDEYKNICAMYGITSGHIDLTQSRDLNLAVTDFVNKCYINAFGRRGDREGLNLWVTKIVSRTAHPIDVVQDFLKADECVNRNLSDSQFIDVAYEVLFGRPAEYSEYEDCLAMLNSGASREKLVSDLVEKDEFATYLAKFDLKPKYVPDKMVALTFDDGPYSPVTNRILDELEIVGGHATFFIVGNRASTYSDCVLRELELGCELANHTWSHPNAGLTTLSYADVVDQIVSCNNELYRIAGVKPSVMRPVGGSYNDSVAAAVDMPIIIWSLDTQDWKYRDADHIVNAILNNVSDGDIILMHDLYTSTAEAMEIVIPELVARGYSLVTVSELAEYKGYDLEDSKAYYSLR